MARITYQQERIAGVRKRVHVWIAERVLGRALPPGAEVHHIDENPFNNTPTNLVICPDAAYHKLLHKRMRALRACGNANWLHCKHCKTYGPSSLFAIYGRHAVRPECAAKQTFNRRATKGNP